MVRLPTVQLRPTVLGGPVFETNCPAFVARNRFFAGAHYES